MKKLLHDGAMAMTPALPCPDIDHVLALRNDVASLTAYEAAARAIFVEANGLKAYYRTYYKDAGKAGWVTGSRKGDHGQVVWREG